MAAGAPRGKFCQLLPSPLSNFVQNEDDVKPVFQPRRRNTLQEVVKGGETLSNISSPEISHHAFFSCFDF